MSTPEPASTATQYLIFTLAHEEYGVPALKVREIVRMAAITRLLQMPPHVAGAFTLRGQTIPIVDLRRKFGLPSDADTERTCIIVGGVMRSGRDAMVGMVVDDVSDVRQISSDDVEDGWHGGEFVTARALGVVQTKDTTTRLLDLDAVLSADAVFAQAA